MSTDAPKIAIVGAGVAGLAAARRFRHYGFRVVLIDKGERLGGRACTRTVNVPGLGAASFDHGAQFWHAHELPGPSGHRFEDMSSLLNEPGWERVAVPWTNSGGYAVRGGMRELGIRLAPRYESALDIRLRSRVESVEPAGGRWILRTDDGEVVRSDGLLVTAPLPQSLALIDRPEIAFPAAEWDELRRVEYTRCLAVLLAIDGTVPPGGVRFDSGPIEFIADNYEKGVSAVGPALTVLTRPDFALANWDAPDDAVVAAVVDALPEWVDRTVRAAQVKRWRYSQVVEPFPEPFALLREPPLALAGDAFAAGGFRTGLNRAFASGTLAADRLIRLFSAVRRAQGVGAAKRPTRPTLEVAVTTTDEARAAVHSGADRLELCADLGCGGLTPSLGAFLAVRAAVRVPVYVMLRPRPGGFAYTSDECDVMKRDAELFLEHGADGVVFGVLTDRGLVAEEPCRPLVKLAGGRAVFHRAFDFVRDQKSGLAMLIALGFERVQTSGKQPTAAEGASQIAALMCAAGWDIEVLPAGGINPSNAAALLADTGCDQVHGSFRGSVADRSLWSNRKLADAMGANPDGWALTTDPGLVAATRVELDRFWRATGE